MKYGGETSPTTRRQALASKPRRVGRDIPVTSRTTAVGDRSGLRIPSPPAVTISRRNGSMHTVEPDHVRDAETGRIRGMKITACKACGHTRRVATATGLCGVRSCITLRRRRFQKRVAQRRAQEWREGQRATT